MFAPKPYKKVNTTSFVKIISNIIKTRSNISNQNESLSLNKNQNSTINYKHNELSNNSSKQNYYVENITRAEPTKRFNTVKELKGGDFNTLNTNYIYQQGLLNNKLNSMQNDETNLGN